MNTYRDQDIVAKLKAEVAKLLADNDQLEKKIQKKEPKPMLKILAPTWLPWLLTGIVCMSCFDGSALLWGATTHGILAVNLLVIGTGLLIMAVALLLNWLTPKAQ